MIESAGRRRSAFFLLRQKPSTIYCSQRCVVPCTFAAYPICTGVAQFLRLALRWSMGNRRRSELIDTLAAAFDIADLLRRRLLSLQIRGNRLSDVVVLNVERVARRDTERGEGARTRTTRFFKFLLPSPLAFISSKLIRRASSLLSCSFFRKARLERRVVT